MTATHARDAAIDIRDALSLLDDRYIRHAQHMLGVMGLHDLKLVRAYLHSALEKLPPAPPILLVAGAPKAAQDKPGRGPSAPLHILDDDDTASATPRATTPAAA